jgi:23S rRNA pseudouridine2457 synthase
MVSLQQEISNPKYKWPKTYVVQVEGKPSLEDLKILQNGVNLKDGKTKPAEVEIID